MAAFKKEINELSRVDWRLLQNGAINLYYRRAILDEDVGWVREHEYTVFTFDCTRWKSEAAFHDDVSRTLGFPDGYGRNLDAFNDSLSDLAVPDDGGVALQLIRFDTFAARLPDIAWHVLDIIDSQSRFHMLFGRRLIALVQSDDGAIRFEQVGAHPVTWNPRELFPWLRGLKVGPHAVRGE